MENLTQLAGSEMDDQVWVEMLKQAPGLAVLVGLVHVFLQHIKAEGAANREAMHELTEVIREQNKMINDLRVCVDRSTNHVE